MNDRDTKKEIQNLWQKIAIVISCLAIGTSASVGIVNYNATKRSEENTCALKEFVGIVKDRVETAGGPNSAEGVTLYTDLNNSLHANCD